MAVPYLYQISAKDATSPIEFTFSWTGSQSMKNKLVVKDNTTNATIYEQTIETMQLKHTVPANILENGKTYNCVVYSIDINNVVSTVSNTIIFKCFSTPSWNFNNVTEGQIINSPSYEPKLSYSQLQGELLDSYEIMLYDSTKVQIYNTGLLYDTNVLSKTIQGLTDNTQYYLRALGKTVNGMDLDTGYISISVDYVSPSIFSLITLENKPLDGCIKISSNMISIEGNSNPSPPTYLDNSWIDLKSNGSYVNFNKGFGITKNGTFQAIGRDFNDYSIIYDWSNGVNKITLETAKGTFNGQTSEKFYMILKVYNGTTYYTLTSNLVNIPTNTDKIHIWIRRINNIYDLKITNLGA